MRTADAFAGYTDAATGVAATVSQISAEQWTWPGLGGWDVRALVGHTSLGLSNVLVYADRPARTEVLTSPEAYYTLRSTDTGEGADAAEIDARARQAGQALGTDPALAFAELTARVVHRLAATDPNDLVETVAGGIRLGSYVATRTVELVVHGHDIAAATGAPVEFSVRATTAAAVVLARTGVARGHGPVLLAALTGRGNLPPGFSVV